MRDDVARLTRPLLELRGFRRIPLAPGETRTVSFTLRPADFGFLDERLRPTIEPGTFTILVGPSSSATKSVRIEMTAP